jgi:queuine tRNA-ribosyltransferase
MIDFIVFLFETYILYNMFVFIFDYIDKNDTFNIGYYNSIHSNELYKNFSFKIRKNNNLARVGEIHTPHGIIHTPAFIFCATKAEIKGLTMQDMKRAKTQIVLSNTYHLEVDPGSEKVRNMGKLQKMTGWNKPMLTDSGGYQIFAMGHGSVAREIKGSKNHNFEPTLLKVDEDGAHFISYKDRTKKIITPEKSIEIQMNLGADIILVFDECTPYNISKKDTEISMERSHRWEKRSYDYFIHNRKDMSQALYGIVQGSVYEDLRIKSCKFCNEMNFFGVAVGGSLGDSKQMMYETVKTTMKYLRKDRPVHLLGIGGIRDIFNGVRNGIDTFDCVHITRIARHGCALVKKINQKFKDDIYSIKEHIDLSKAPFKNDHSVIDKNCGCETCKSGISKSYLNFLIKSRGLTYGSMIMIHNVYFMNELMSKIRYAILHDCLDEIEKEYIHI